MPKCSSTYRVCDLSLGASATAVVWTALVFTTCKLILLPFQLYPAYCQQSVAGQFLTRQRGPAFSLAPGASSPRVLRSFPRPAVTEAGVQSGPITTTLVPGHQPPPPPKSHHFFCSTATEIDGRLLHHAPVCAIEILYSAAISPRCTM